MKAIGRGVGSIMPWKANMTCASEKKKRCFFGKTDPGKESDKLKIESNI